MKPNLPYVFDVDNDPKEMWNLNASNAWISRPIGKIVAAYAASLKGHPNIKPGSKGPAEGETPAPEVPSLENSD